MRIPPSKFRSEWPSALRFAGLFLLTVLLLFPVSVFARTTQATLSRERRARRLHVASHHGHRRHLARTRSNHPVSHSFRSRESARLHRPVRYGRRVRGRRYARRYRVEAALDDIRTHTPSADTPRANAEAAAATTNQIDTSRPPALIASPDLNAGAGSAGSTSTGRDLPFFQASIPRYMPAALRGSHEVLVHQNIIADVESLSRIQNDAQLRAMVHSGDLVALPASSALAVDPRLPLNRRYCRPWVAKFLSDLSRAHESVFGHPLVLTSAVRTVDFQLHLAHYNGNAAPAYGDTASPHLTGQAIDIGKKGMSLREIAWMRTVLGQLQSAGKLDVEEEFEQACFHLSVYKTYAPHTNLPTTLVASNEPASETAQPQNTAIGGLAQPVIQTVSEPVERHNWHPHRYYSAHAARRAAVRRRRRRHHAAMSLLAVRMR